MATSFELNAQPRERKGTGASRRLRRADRAPGVLYGGKKDPALFSMDHNELVRHLTNEAVYSTILTLKMGGEEQQVVLKDLQRHPYKPRILHLDLLRVQATEKIRLQAPLRFVGADVAPGVKQGGGTVFHHLTEVEVSCLPKDLPEYIEVDVSQLELGGSIHLSELSLSAGVELVALFQGAGYDQTVATIQAARMALEEEEVEQAEEIEAEAEQKKEQDQGKGPE